MEYSAVNTIWILFGTALVFFMQAGFAMLETGLTRAKNAGNIIMKYIMNFCIGSIVFWIVGFGLMHGGKGLIIGSFKGLASESAYGLSMIPNKVPFWAYMTFQTVFATIAAAIVSGAMAERMKFRAFCIYSAVFSLLIYPIAGHWIWGGGWLEQLGFHDFAGSTTVHMVGGVTAFVGAAMLGPRIGKYAKNGKSKAIPGHSLSIAALGIFILWFCWFGFNGASTVSMEGNAIYIAGKIFFNTNISAAVSACIAMIVTWIKNKKPDISITLNGALGGLVAITAECDTVSSVGAAVTGLLAGLTVVFLVEIMENKIKVDDPVGAVSVHGGCGLLGTIGVGLFSDGTGSAAKGLFTGGGVNQLGIQCLGALVVGIYVAVAASIIFTIIRKTVGLRVLTEEEMDGLDVHENNLSGSYEDFLSTDGISAPMLNVPRIPEEKFDFYSGKTGDTLISKIVIIAKQNKLDSLLHAMNDIGVTGVTITNVTGYGIQKGSAKNYRSSEIDINLLPKVKVEIVVSTVPVSKIIATVEKILYTGQYGDGKIFIYDVRNVVKVRTGEEGFDALVDKGEEG